jgi:hypothetical protein
MKRTIQRVAFMIWYAYFFVTVLAVPVFNWQYARQHGFVSWFCLGEVVATAKATIWPYYAITAWQNHGKAEDVLDAHFVNSRRASHQALLIIDDEDGLLKVTDPKRKEVLQLLESAAAEASLVQNSFLQEIHVEFPHNWKEGYTVALTDLIDGLKTKDEQKQIAGVTRYNAFSDWVQNHAHEMRILR